MKNITVSEIKVDDLVIFPNGQTILVEALGKDGSMIQVAGVYRDAEQQIVRDVMATAPPTLTVLIVD